MIRSFRDRASEDLYHDRPTRKARSFPADVVPGILRKLDMLDSARRLEDLAALPGSRLEALRGDLKGFHSLRVNDQWRIVFRWDDGNALDVEAVDYHD